MHQFARPEDRTPSPTDLANLGEAGNVSETALPYTFLPLTISFEAMGRSASRVAMKIPDAERPRLIIEFESAEHEGRDVAHDTKEVFRLNVTPGWRVRSPSGQCAADGALQLGDLTDCGPHENPRLPLLTPLPRPLPNATIQPLALR